MTAGILTSHGVLSTQTDRFIAANSLQPTAGANASLVGQPGSTSHGICSLTYGGQVFRFRTNPNEIWWDYELVTHVEQTYGGRVVQILGTRLGDLTVKVECGKGGWDYMMSTVAYLRNVLSDQRSGNTATFEYTTRNWKMNVYSLSLPFEDEVTATVREMTLQFKIQEDVSGIASQASLDKTLASLVDGVYRPGDRVRNEYSDHDQGSTGLSALGIDPNINIPKAGTLSTSGIVNPVDSSPQGNGSALTGLVGGLPFLSSIPGLSNFGIGG